ncbi:thermophilic serine proteinase [Geobacter sp. OR-1]|uniref:putative Ig domain-containing protein n=1 Tax=Geobacter sp. OR-1 TaxID=1266765 RepID=UPI000543C6DB|nr:putative Ig domain-containing protein [Geobacter sp. OR-1]GAM07794.1 thermophilic serine proteinase [Geobacter sp. OR-1]
MRYLSRILILFGSLLFLSSTVFAGGATESGNRWRNPAIVLHPDDPEHIVNKRKGRQPEFKEDELIVKFKPGLSKSGQQSVHSRHGGEKLKEFKKLRIHKIRIPKGENVTDAMKRYKEDADVEYAEPNYRVHSLSLPNDPRFNETWGLRNTGQTGGTSGADINVSAAWDVSTGDSTVVVATVDTGIDYNHGDLSANVWRNPLELPGNGIDDDNNGYIDDVYGIDTINHDSNPADDEGHGTHVAGTIGAIGNNATGVAGINWNVKILSCKFLGSDGGGYTDGAIECLDYIKDLKDNGVNIVAVNHSWGCSGGGWSGSCYSQALYDAMNAQRDILQIAAAGNDSQNNDVNEAYPANYQLPNIISVAATDHNDRLAWFSNYGRQSVHVAAPGDNILSTVPGGYASNSGTSMATPHVTGLAALLKAADPDRSWIEIRNLILSSGDEKEGLTGGTVTGKRINAYNALSCSGVSSITPLKFPTSLTAGTPVIISVLSSACGVPSESVTMTTSGNQTFPMLDDGQGEDKAANDGIFTLTWTPAASTPEKLTFSSPTASKVIVVPEFSITSNTLTPGIKNKPYTFTLAAVGGLAPYTWAITSGTLPAGLSLDSATGVISGTPTSNGEFSFTVQATESFGASKTKTVFLFIALHDYSLDWSKVYFSSGGFDFANDVAIDRFGHIYVAGYRDGSLGVDKFDRSGDPLWSRSLGNSQGIGIAVDRSGNAYITGYHSLFSPVGDNYYIMTKKYTTNGSEVWSRETDNGHTWMDPHGSGIALNSSGDIFVSGMLESGNSYDGVALKYDNAGNQLWSRPFGSNSTEKLMGMATDGTGAAYGTGFTNSGGTYDFLTIKYDSATGGTLWSKGFNNGRDDYAYRVAVDDSGNVYVTGESGGSSGKTYCLTIKYDSAGNLVWQKDYQGGDYCRSVAVDGNGRVYVAGRSNAGLISGTPVNNYNAFFLVYDTDGTLLGSKYFDYRVDSAYGIAVDRSGENIYLAGYSASATDLLNYDYLLLHYTADRFFISEPELLPVGEVGLPYAKVLATSGGAAPYSWTITGGALPPGLSLDQNTGELRGTPENPGSFEFSIGVTEAGAAVASKALHITVMGISPQSLSTGVVGTPYSQTMTVSGGAVPYRWEVESGSLPTGLTLDVNTGAISGTPSMYGSFPFTVRVTDQDGYHLSKSHQVNVFGISTPSLANGTIGQPYSQSLTASNGTEPLTWSVPEADLPTGLALDPQNGTITGTPLVYGAWPLTVTVRDFQGFITQKSFTLTIYDSLRIEAPQQSTGTVGRNYTNVLTASGGAPPYSWSLDPASLPPGVSFYPTTGALYGTPTTAGSYAVTVTLTDAAGATITQNFTIDIKAMTLASADLAAGFLNTAYSQQLTASGGSAPLTWSITTGGLPEGLTLDSATGVIAGVPTQTGRTLFTIRATDSQSLVSDREYFIEIGRSFTQLAGGVSGLIPDLTGTMVILNGTTSGCYMPGNLKLTTLAYDNDGNGIWETKSTCYASLESGGMSATPDGSLLGVGMSYYSTILKKYLPTGAIAWTRTFSPENGYCSGTSQTRKILQAATDGAGNILIGGEIQCDGNPGRGAFLTTKTDAGGTVIWSKTLATATNQLSVSGIAVEQSGNAVISGKSGSYEYTTAKYDPDGNLLWSRSFSNGSSIFETYGPVLDSSGNSYSSFTSYFSGNYTAAYQFIVVKYDPSGKLLWARSGPLTEKAQGIGIDNKGDLYISGNSGKFFFYSSDGSPLRSKSYPVSNSYQRRTAINGEGRMYLVDRTSGGNSTLSIFDPLAIDETAIELPRGIETGYRLKTSGGTLPYTWAISNGALPAGLSLEPSSGMITGTPQESGSTTLTVSALDAEGNNVAKVITLVVDDLLLSGTTLPTGTTGVTYAFDLKASGLATPFSWGITNGALPAGIDLDPVSGRIQGIPGSAGDYAFSVQVTDQAGRSRAAGFSLTIRQPVAIATTSLPAADLTQFPSVYIYTQLQAEGGAPPYNWRLSSGALPSGIALNPVSGEISGNLTATGNHQLTIEVTDLEGRKTTRNYELSGFSLTPLYASISGTVGSSFTMTLGATGGRPPYTWKVSSGALPAGLSLNMDSGQITGTLQAPAPSHNVGFELTDAGGSRITPYLPVEILPLSCSYGPMASDRVSGYYNSFPTLYSYAPDNAVIQMQAFSYSGDLDFNRGVKVLLRGGYNCSFTPQDYYTVVSGNLTVTAGSVTVSNIIIK